MNQASIPERQTLQPTHTFRFQLFQLYKWLIYGPILLISTVSTALLVLLCCSFFPRFCNQVLVPAWCRLNTYAVFSTTRVTGEQYIDPEQSYIIVANHLSNFDILALYGWLKLDIRWVMKQELRKIPLFGAAAEKLGHICVDRKNPERARSQMVSAQQQFTAGSSIIFFPEGTRSEDGELKPFKSGAFKMAKELQLPILPVAIVGTDAMASARSVQIYPGTAEVRIQSPITTADVNSLTVGELNKMARDAIANGR